MDDRTARAKAWLQKLYPHSWQDGASVNIQLLPKELTLFADSETSHLEAENKRLREGLEEAKETIESMPCFCKIGRICSSCQSIAKIKAILNGDIEREEVEKK